MRRTARLLVAGWLLVSMTGCYTWVRQPQPATQPPAYRNYQVWTGDSAITLQNVRVEQDTLSGTPPGDSRDCDRCTIRIPMTQVDSLKTGNTAHVGTALLGVLAGVAAVYLILIISLSGSQD